MQLCGQKWFPNPFWIKPIFFHLNVSSFFMSFLLEVPPMLFQCSVPLKPPARRSGPSKKPQSQQRTALGMTATKLE